MRYPLKNQIYEKLSQEKHMTDVDLLTSLTKDGWDILMKDLNKALLHLEILGLITVRWIGKDRRRIEFKEDQTEQEQIQT